MVLVKIDIKNIASETHPDDKVVFRSPVVREAVDGGLVSTADEVVSLVDGVGEVELVPGPVIVTFQCRGMADTRPKRGTVPDSGPVTVADVIGQNFTFTPEVVGAAQAARDQAVQAAADAGNASDSASGYAQEAKEYRDAVELAAAGVGAPVSSPVENVAMIQAEIDRVAGDGGGTVVLTHGATYTVSGTIHMQPNITLDLNRATIIAAPNANFETVDLGTRTDLDGATVPYNPATVKPIISVHGVSNGARLTGITIRNGTIDGNGEAQPDDGSYANIAVVDADGTVVEDVTSVRSRPNLTINTGADRESGANTGRRAFCLLIGRALGTVVSRGFYSDSGYDSIGLRNGADSTQLIGVHSAKAWKGSIQAGSQTYRTKIIGGIWDNRTGESGSSHAIYCHTSTDFLVTGATIRASKGSCLAAFGTNVDGYSENVVIKDSTIEHNGSDAHVLNFGNGYVRNCAIDNVVFSKTAGNGQFLFISGATIAGMSVRRARGTLTGASSAIVLQNAADVALSDCDIASASTGNPMVMAQQIKGLQVLGGSYRNVGGSVIHMEATASARITGISATGNNAVRAYGDSSGIDVTDCDFTALASANPLRLYGTTGTLRGNRGAPTEGSGMATITAGATSVTVPHGLWAGTSTTVQERIDRVWQPKDFQVSFASPPAGSAAVWVSAVTPTSVTLSVNAAPSSDVQVAWSARMDRQS